MELATAGQVRAALAENDDQPYGGTRIARAEEIAAAAEALDDPPILASALCDLMRAYEYGAEHAKGPVAFARLLRLLDTHPESFGPAELYRTYWYFKWVTTFMTDIPDVPLAAVTGWIADMERRYKLAGYSMRTVAGERLWLALHTGDLPRADQALRDMLSLPRDKMSDCAACEDRLIGRAHLQAGRDRKALAVWDRVLSGKRRCLEEPHFTLSLSLLPLLRLGRAEEASANHMRGYQMTRGNVNLASAIGSHMEFCALTGNAGRGLEILADSQPMLTMVTDPLPRLHFLTGVAVLLRRLAATGYGGIPLASRTGDELAGQVTAEATEIAARFDARNGTTWIGDELRQRLEQPPFSATVRLSRPASLAAQDAEPGPAAPDDLDALVAAARSLSLTGHPDAPAAWARVAGLAGDVSPGSLLAGELAEEQAMVLAHQLDWTAAAAGLKTASSRFEAASHPGRAVAAAARAEWAAAMGDPEHDPWPAFDAQLARVSALLDADQARPRDLLVVRNARAIVALEALARAVPAGQPGLTARLASETDALSADARTHDSPALEATAEVLVSSVSRLTGDASTETARLQHAVELLEQAGRPWATTVLRLRLGELMFAGHDPPAAAALLEEAIATATAWPRQEFPSGPAHMLLAAAYRAQQETGLAVANARMGLARFARDEDHLTAALARSDLGLSLAEAGQLDEAVSILEEAIVQLSELAGAEAAAPSRLTLAQCLRQGGDHRGAAQQFALAAETFEAGSNTDAYLFSAAEAALSLAEAGLWPQAHQAYDRAIALADAHQGWSLLVKLHRELAQVVVRDGLADGPARALHHIAQALAAGEKAGADGGNSFVRARERGRTCYQAGRALDHALLHAQALDWLERAIADFTPDDGGVDDLAQATHLAASIEAVRLGRTQAAAQRLTAVIERCAALGYEPGITALTQLADRISAGTRPA